MELTPEQVAQQLKLSVRQVIAIEQEAFDELPSNLFIRGFVRNYARLLKIDAEPLLAAVELEPVGCVRAGRHVHAGFAFARERVQLAMQ